MRSYFLFLFEAILLCTTYAYAQNKRDFQLNDINAVNDTVSSLIETINQQLDGTQNSLEKLQPRYYVMFTILGCIIIPTITFLVKIALMQSYKKMLLRPSADHAAIHLADPPTAYAVHHVQEP
jgi:hypothetical protein